MMDFFDALASLTKLAPEYESALRNALDAEVEYTERGMTGRNQYARAVEAAHDRIKDWIEQSDEYLVGSTLDMCDMLRFATSHRYAVIIAVLVGKMKKVSV